MNRLLLIPIAILGLSACATTGTDTADKASQDGAAMASNEASDSNLICKRQTVVGSNFKRKICATAEQWEAEEEASRATTGDIQRRGQSPGVSN